MKKKHKKGKKKRESHKKSVRERETNNEAMKNKLMIEKNLIKRK